jgi:hypothetical protein
MTRDPVESWSRLQVDAADTVLTAAVAADAPAGLLGRRIGRSFHPYSFSQNQEHPV